MLNIFYKTIFTFLVDRKEFKKFNSGKFVAESDIFLNFKPLSNFYFFLPTRKGSNENCIIFL